MGFLKNLLNPKNFIHMNINPIGATNAALHGGTKSLDPKMLYTDFSGGYGFGGTQKAQPAGADTGAGGGADPSVYGGDPNDPAFGSFTKPFTVEDFYANQDPGYAFELQQGTQSLQNAASAGSGAFSGAALKDLLGYSQNFARTGYNDAFNRFQTSQGNIFNRLSDIAHLGQASASGVGAQGTQLAGNAGQFISNAGSAAGAGLVGAGNALGDGITNYWLMHQFQNRPVAGGAPGSI